MVCSLGDGRMAVMARILAAGSLSQNANEEVNKQKLAAQCIAMELRNADEANLLDEEDMHVFGLNPMTGPLHLVCCNACKKPVKDSQYAAHAELCRTLNLEEIKSETDGGVGRRKPPRKERKRLLNSCTNQAKPAGEQRKHEDGSNSAPSESQRDGKRRKSSSISITLKKKSSIMDAGPMVSGQGASPETAGQSATVIPPSMKRIKITLNQHLPLQDNPETASTLTKVPSTQDSFPHQDFQIPSTSGLTSPNDSVLISKHHGKSPDHDVPARVSDIPVPLATKIYYSQRHNRLRSAVAQMYHMPSANGICNGVTSLEFSQERAMQMQASLSQRKSSLAHVDGPHGCSPAATVPNQFPVDNIPRPQTAPIKVRLSKSTSKPHSFVDNSGQPRSSVQQLNGSIRSSV